MATPLEIAFLATMYFKCGVGVNPETLHAIVTTESNAYPYVVANVSDGTSHKFDTELEAISFVNALESQGKTYSAGLMQIYSKNYKAYGVDNNSIFNPCTNINIGSKILKECFDRSKTNVDGKNLSHLERAFSCYYSGNFTRGFKVDDNYVARVIANYSSLYEVPSYSAYSDKQGKEVLSVKTGSEKEVSFNDPVEKPRENSWDIFNDFTKKE